MATFSKLPSGRWRVQIRRGDIYRAATFDKKGDARDWATQIEAQAEQVQKGGLISPKGLKVGHLVEMYRETVPGGGRTKAACLARLEDRLKRTTPDRLAFALRDYIDRRQGRAPAASRSRRICPTWRPSSTGHGIHAASTLTPTSRATPDAA